MPAGQQHRLHEQLLAAGASQLVLHPSTALFFYLTVPRQQPPSATTSHRHQVSPALPARFDFHRTQSNPTFPRSSFDSMCSTDRTDRSRRYSLFALSLLVVATFLLASHHTPTVSSSRCDDFSLLARHNTSPRRISQIEPTELRQDLLEAPLPSRETIHRLSIARTSYARVLQQPSLLHFALIVVYQRTHRRDSRIPFLRGGSLAASV